LEGFEDIVAPMKGFLDACLISLDRPSARFDAAKLQGARAAIIGAAKGLEGNFSFLALDFLRGRWNTEDLITLKGPLRELVAAYLALLQFQIYRIESRSKLDKLSQF